MTALFFSAIIRAPAVFSFGIHMFAVAFGTITGRGETAFPEKTAPEISEVVEPGLKRNFLHRLAGLPQRPAGGGDPDAIDFIGHRYPEILPVKPPQIVRVAAQFTGKGSRRNRFLVMELDVTARPFGQRIRFIARPRGTAFRRLRQQQFAEQVQPPLRTGRTGLPGSRCSASSIPKQSLNRSGRADFPIPANASSRSRETSPRGR